LISSVFFTEGAHVMFTQNMSAPLCLVNGTVTTGVVKDLEKKYKSQGTCCYYRYIGRRFYHSSGDGDK
jgi:hypothetical protein